MFIKDTIDNNNLVFIKSKYIKAFPCGRRRSELVDSDNNKDTVSDRYYIPFDPEARLNTEANNRKHSGLNGYKQSYLSYWNDNGDISLVLGGYLFDIASDYSTVNDFGAAIAKANMLNISNGGIFVNVKLAKVSFFQGTKDVPQANTEILRDQSTHADPLPCLDLLYGTDKTSIDSYYFSGLSFSSSNLAAEDTDGTEGWISLPLLDGDNGAWKIHEASRLPVIEHGDERDSIKIPGSLTIENNLTVEGEITTSAVKVKNGNEYIYATTLKVDPKTNQLQFWTRPMTEAES